MALVLADRVRETTTVTGTGTATLLGAVSGYQSFAAVGNANTTYYVIANQSASEWEVGIGTYTSSGTTLSRTTVLSSSNGGSLVNFSAGTKDVFVDYPASKAVYEDASGNIDSYPITNGTINGTTVGATTASTGRFTTVQSTVATGTAPFTVASTTPVSNLSIGGNAGTVTNGVYTTDTGTVTNAMLAGSIANNKLVNSSITFGSTAQALGTTVSGLSGVTLDNGVIGATTPAAGTFTTLTSTGNITYFGGVSGSDVVRIYKDNTVSGTTASFTAPAFSFIAPQSGFGASIFNVGLNSRITTNGTDGIYLTTGGSLGFAGVVQSKFAHTASAVNYVQVTGAATGGHPTISSQGSDSNARLILNAKGTSSGIDLLMNNTRQVFIGTNGSAVNYLQLGGTAAGVSPSVSVLGSDTDIDLNLTPKGAGNVRFGTYTASALLAVAGYITIKDSGGTTRRLLVG